MIVAPLRYIKAPDLFIQDYELMLLVMGFIQADVRRGTLVLGTCHVIARALARRFPNFRVADGFVPRMTPPDFDADFGVKATLTIPEQGIVQDIRFQQLYHSWLVWKSDERFIIDPWPVGGLSGCSLPTARPQDAYDIIYTEDNPSQIFKEEEIAASVEHFHSRIVAILDELARAYNGPSQKTPS